MVPRASDFEHEGHKLIIFEDLFDELCDNLGISKFFTFLSRKCCVSTILTAQNPYAPSKFGLTIRAAEAGMQVMHLPTQFPDRIFRQRHRIISIY